MILNDRATLKQDAEDALHSAHYPPSSLAMIHAGVIVGVALLLTLLNFLLGQSAAAAQGLAGMGTRSFLASIQSFLSMANSLLMPFWEAGLTFCALLWARQQTAKPMHLSQGFRRFGPLLRLYLLKGMILLALIMGCTYLCSFLFLATPLSSHFFATAESLIGNAAFADPAAIVELLTPKVLPLVFVTFVLTALAAAFVMYRYRMADYLILDNRTNSALLAMSISRQMMKRRMFALFKLDLSFWWFYGALILLNLVSSLHTLLPQFGVQLPINPNVFFFLCYFVYLAGVFLLYWYARPQVLTTYALVYDRLLPKEPEVNPWQTRQ